MNPTQLEELKRALRKQWEAEQEIARIEKVMLDAVAQPTTTATGSLHGQSADQGVPQQLDSMNALGARPGTIPSRIIDFFTANAGRAITTGEIVSALSDANAPSVRSALNRMIGHGVERATDPDGNVRREHYVLSREGS